ncbi:MAG: ribonuclease PH [Candidatus Stahlbacteria bacterium]|nr:ribonuclease PH [Candidatus Stahlbacteria bacterium]
MRTIKIEKDYLKDAEGSCLIELGETKIICSTTVESRVPYFLKDKRQGWITAEYGMLPRSTKERISRNRDSGRLHEIQRLIGRSLRNVCDLSILNGFTIAIDCDVIQADGGTRTASITGAYVALHDACQYMIAQGLIDATPLHNSVVGVSVGIIDGVQMLDLTYEEDERAEVDMNIVMTEELKLVEVQGTGERKAFTYDEFINLIKLAEHGIKNLIDAQRKALFLLI